MSVILVVDDEEDIRELVGIYLKNEACRSVRRQTVKRRGISGKMDIDLAI